MEDRIKYVRLEWANEVIEVENLFLNKEGFPLDSEDMPDREECRQLAATLMLVQAVRDVRDAINNLES